MKKIIGICAVIAVLATATTGCLKDKGYTGDQQNNIKGLSFGPSTSTAITGQSLPLMDSASTAVVLQGSGTSSTDIPYKLAIDNSLVTDPDLTPLPAANVSLETDGVIKAGTFSSKVKVTILKSDELDPNNTYALGLRITNAPAGYVIASNIGVAILTINIKNRIDGVYQYTTSATTSLAPNMDVEVELITKGPNAVSLDAGGGASLLATYSNPTSYAVDKVTNQVTVTSTLTPNTPPDPRSKFDPVTHNMVVYWTSGSRKFEETFTYKRPRD